MTFRVTGKLSLEVAEVSPSGRWSFQERVLRGEDDEKRASRLDEILDCDQT